MTERKEGGKEGRREGGKEGGRKGQNEEVFRSLEFGLR